jgi:hypothetical protein
VAKHGKGDLMTGVYVYIGLIGLCARRQARNESAQGAACIMIATLYAGLIAFAALASYGGALAVYNRILRTRARMASRCFLVR